MAHPKLVDKDTGRLPNLSAEETAEFKRLLDKHLDRVITTAENGIFNFHFPEPTQSELMRFFELYHKSKHIRLIPET